MVNKTFIFFLLFICLSLFGGISIVFGQEVDSTVVKTAIQEDSVSHTDSLRLGDSLVIGSDSLANLQDSNKTTGVVDKEAAWGVKFAKDGLDKTVTNSADDSAVLDIKNKVFYLYGNARAQYDDIDVTSGEMVYYQETNTLNALPKLDTAGKITSDQIFKQGTEQFTYDTLRYNFKSQRAIVFNARTHYGEGFLISQQIKLNADGSTDGWKNIYTTCDLPNPHFGIRAKKIRVVPKKLIASGPANLVIAGIPTPLYLPFGIFPISEKQHSGFIIPSYTMEAQRGLGIQRGGYYFSINDHLGLISQFDFFSRGSWAFFSTAQYATRYRYSGSLSINYSYTKLGESFESNSSISKDFQVNWQHSVDPKAHPGTTLSANVNFGTSSYNQVNGMDNYNNILDNQYSSSISYSKTWAGKPYSLTAALRHSQSTQSHRVTVSLPEINFSLGQFTPFRRKNPIGSPKWYEQISVSYSATERNNWDFIDTNFSLSRIQFRDFNNGILHNLNISANYKVMKYFTLNFGMPYREYWNTKQTFYNRNPQTNEVDTTTNLGFFATRDFNISVGLTTRIYGMKLFPKGKIRGIRHVITPTISATYTPGFAHSPFGYMYETVDAFGFSSFHSPYSLSPIGGPSNPDNNGSIGFSINNTLQLKVQNNNPKDSTAEATKNVSIIDGLSVSGNYNIFADSFNLSLINVNFHTLLANKINLSANAVFDPYKYEDGRRTKEYLASEHWYKLLKFRSANVAFGFSFRGQKKKGSPNTDSAANHNDEIHGLLDGDRINDYYDFSIPWNISVNGGVSIIKQARLGRSDTTMINPNLTFSGGFNLTPRWQVNFNSGLQFRGLKKIDLGLTNINISRDLHCWQMSLNLIPFGQFRSFNFILRVKSAVLQDLKLVRRRTYQDNF